MDEVPTIREIGRRYDGEWFRFAPRADLVVVEVGLFGAAGFYFARLALDTGANTTLLDDALLEEVGYRPRASDELVVVATGSGVELVPRRARVIEVGGVRRSPQRLRQPRIRRST
jgi:hypothetical protein